MVEAHRALQKQLDDKSADEIWDLKEEFRFEKEDREAAYEAACQKIRESTKQEELQANFEEVLHVLEGIQQSYRNYHSNACFANDRYPLMLIHEFRSYITTVAKNFFLAPDVSHQIITEYERIFDQTIRFNRKYFEENPAAGGVERLPLPDSPPIPEDIPDALEPIELLSPFLRNTGPPPGVYTGKFYWLQTSESVTEKFRNMEGAFAATDPHAPSEATTAGSSEDTAHSGKDAQDEATNEASDIASQILAQSRAPHTECSFVNASCPMLPLRQEEFDALDADAREDYARVMSKHFIDLGDPSDIPEEPEVPAKPVKGSKAPPLEEKPVHPLSKLDGDTLQLYTQTKELALRTKKRLAEEAETSYILAHPPLDPRGESWVRVIEITSELVLQMVGDIRDSIITALEKEAFKRVNFAEKQCVSSKAELTDQLEDQIRNHWPRRGRVETQIKQPREAELLGHKEKTWRHISTIQQKMIQAQERFGEALDAGRSECNAYINEMTALRNSLSGEFKNLAFLQAIDVKARGTTLDFQANSVKSIAVLAQLAQEETEVIIAYARDFRKICPPQVPGVEGGYSESEILEIEAIVEGQCAEIKGIATEWQEGIHQLKEEQVQSLKCQEEFAARYKKSTQDVAMSEGLGQKYGAPRRRAQERIRTEVGRDERSAGKLDALLAKLEFSCAETERAACQPSELATLSVTSDKLPETASGGAPMFPLGQEELFQCTVNWNLLVQVRLSLQQRVKYLRIIDGALPECPELPWLSKDRIALCSEVGIDTGATELAELMGDQASMTLEEVFEEVDKTCRQETRQLYESEGLGSVLGAGGVPEALQTWLTESREKLLGQNGHREKAWKRLWAQVLRSEHILARHLVAAQELGTNKATVLTVTPIENTAYHGGETGKTDSKYTTKLGVPAICLRSLVAAFIHFAREDKATKSREFDQLLAVWEKGREKHERLLRPRLGSPDLAEELSELDRIESQRSAELVEHVGRFRTLLVRTQTEHFQSFLEDVGLCGKSLIQLLDSTLRQEQLQVPPDTAVPKKHMTLKKLRKAQRIREQVAQGLEDRSQVRVWEGIDLTFASELVRSAEDMVLDLGKNPKDTAVTASASAATPAPPEKKDGKKAAPTKGLAPPETPTVSPSLMPPSWIAAVTEKSAVKGLVSTAHRIVVTERDAAVARFAQYLAACLEEIRTDYDTVLKQENSWNERWKRQVDMLRCGNL